MFEYVVKYSHPTGTGTVTLLSNNSKRAVIEAWTYINETRGNDWADLVRFDSVNGEKF